ncbi:hypothetical protein BY996DRAFT_6499472 [Phakopsora pachyrhizi]|nr:hypothetical protein BY996DRAFT_6499472 [Phakopsora pachyrhizi]
MPQGAYRRVAIGILKIVGILLQSRIPREFMDPQLQLELAGPIHRWSYQLPFINHFETIHTGPLDSLISHGGLSVGLSLMDSL